MPGSFPEFKLDLDTSSPGTLTKTIPGKIVMAELSAYYYEHFRMTKVNTVWFAECEQQNYLESEAY
jgi:hypothetical protein